MRCDQDQNDMLGRFFQQLEQHGRRCRVKFVCAIEQPDAYRVCRWLEVKASGPFPYTAGMDVLGGVMPTQHMEIIVRGYYPVQRCFLPLGLTTLFKDSLIERCWVLVFIWMFSSDRSSPHRVGVIQESK